MTGAAGLADFPRARRVVVVADQLTKAWIVAHARRRARRSSIVGDYLRLVYGQNNGALFGLFRENARCCSGSSRSWSSA